MLDHCCEGTLYLKNLRQAKYVKSYGDDLCQDMTPMFLTFGRQD